MADKTTLKNKLSFITKVTNLAERLKLSPTDTIEALDMVRREQDRRAERERFEATFDQPGRQGPPAIVNSSAGA